MRKRLLAAGALTLSLITFAGAAGASAAFEECMEAAAVTHDDVTGRVYSTEFFGTNGGIRYTSGDTRVLPLPDGMMNLGEIYQICIYHGRLYYVTGDAGSDYLPASIYSCNMSGGDNKLIADNACNFSKVTIVDGVLYYDAFSSEMEPYFAGYTGGIFKINLEDLAWQRIVSDSNCKMDYCDGDYIYYTVNGRTFAIDTNGSICFAARSDTDEFKNDYYIRGNKTYYLSQDGRNLCVKTLNGDDETVLASYSGPAEIVGMSNSKIYVVEIPEHGSTDTYTSYAYVNSVQR